MLHLYNEQKQIVSQDSIFNIQHDFFIFDGQISAITAKLIYTLCK